AAEGDGGSLDIARQLVRLLPDTPFLFSIEGSQLPNFLAAGQTWPVGRPGRITVVPQPCPLAQWAEDNGKPGTLAFDVSPEDEKAPPAKQSEIRNPKSIKNPQSAFRNPQWFTLLPRFATRGELGAEFVPAESFIAETLAAAG